MLDRQIDFNDAEGLKKLGQWLARRFHSAEQRLSAAVRILAACGVSEAELAREWEAQVAAQIVKPNRTSRTIILCLTLT